MELPPIFAATVTFTFAPSPLGETTAVIFSPQVVMLMPVLKEQEHDRSSVFLRVK